MESVKYLPLQSRVFIELIGGDKYTGTLKNFNQKFKFVELTELNELSDDVNKRKICGKTTFFESEIVTIRALDTTPMASIDSAESTKSSTEFASAEASSIHEWHTTTINETEVQEINNKILSAIYITQCDASYHAAVADLQRQEMVGLNIEGARLGRLQPGSLLSISTNTKIYLFDLMMLGRIFKDIKQILEAGKPRKVVHNSALICDHLKNLYKCHLNGFQDTLVGLYYPFYNVLLLVIVYLQMIHCQIKKKLKEISIHDCLSEYFKLPETSEQKVCIHCANIVDFSPHQL